MDNHVTYESWFSNLKSSVRELGSAATNLYDKFSDPEIRSAVGDCWSQFKDFASSVYDDYKSVQGIWDNFVVPGMKFIGALLPASNTPAQPAIDPTSTSDIEADLSGSETASRVTRALIQPDADQSDHSTENFTDSIMSHSDASHFYF